MKKINLLFLFLLQIVFSGGLAQAQSIELRLPDTTSVKGSVLCIPIYADSSLTGADVSSYTLQVSYEPYYFQYEGLIISGTISETFGMPTVNTSIGGRITIAGSGSSPLTGKGKFIILKLKALNEGWSSLGFTDAKHNILNEGTPSLILRSSSVSISSAPSIIITPDKSIIAKGEQLQMEILGGEAPFQWSVTEDYIAGIDQNGLLTATGAGNTKVVAVDNAGVVDTSGIIEIRPVRLSIPGNFSQWEGETVNVPVLASDMTGLSINSGSFRLIFDGAILSPESIVQTSTLLGSSNVAFNKKNTGSVRIAFSASTDIAGSSDTLLIVRFKVIPGSSGSSNVEISDALFNENILAATTSGTFTVKDYPYSQISPNGENMTVGEMVNLSMYGETFPPYTWSVSDADLATIDANGILTVKKRGKVTVTVVDTTGATVISNPFEIFDTRVSMSDTVICDYSQTVDYPVWIDKIPKDSIYSVQGKITFNAENLDYVGLKNSATVMDGWSNAINASAGTVSFAFSGTKPIKNAGVLFYLQLKPKESFQNSTWANIKLQNLAFNEGLPVPLIQSYDSYIKGAELYEGFVYIKTVTSVDELCSGDMSVFASEVYNVRNASYQWLVNRNEIPDATGDTLRIKTLEDKDTVTCRVTSNDPCLQSDVMLSNAIGVNVSYVPAVPDTIIGPVVVRAGANGVSYSVEKISGANSYIWVLPDGMSGSSDLESITVDFSESAQSGWIQVRALGNCGEGGKDSLYVTVSPLVDLKDLQLKPDIYPNPFNEEIHIISDLLTGQNVLVEVYDATGRLLKIDKSQIMNEMTLNFKNQFAGLYLIKISYEGANELYKVVKR